MRNYKHQMSNENLKLTAIIIFLALLQMSFSSYSQPRNSERVSTYVVHDEQKFTSADEMIKRGITDAREYVRVGQSFLEKRSDIAEGFFRHAISLVPDVYQSYSYMYYIKISNGQYDSAEYYARKAVELNPRSPQIHLDLSVALTKLKRGDEAKKEVETAAIIDPEYVTRFGAQFITSRSAVSRALYFFRIVHQTAPYNVINNLNYSYTLRMKRQFVDAHEVLVNIFDDMEQSSNYFDLTYNLYFKLLMDQGKYKEVIQTASINVDATYPNQYLYKALSHYKLGELVEFERISQRYFVYDSEQRPPQSLTGWANNQINQIEKVRRKTSRLSTKM